MFYYLVCLVKIAYLCSVILKTIFFYLKEKLIPIEN